MDKQINKEFEKDFHQRRIAFIIINDEILFLKNSTLSHYEWYKELTGSEDRNEFNKLVRGYYLDGSVTFYKGDFKYDEECIKAANDYCYKIKDYCKVDKLKVYCGVLAFHKTQNPWPMDLYLKEI